MMAKLSYFFSFRFIVIGIVAGFAGVYFMNGLGKGESRFWTGFCVQDDEHAVPLSCVNMDTLMRRYGRMEPGEAAKELEVVLSNRDLEIDDGTTVLLYYLAYRGGQAAIPFLSRLEKSGDKQRGDFLLAAVQGWADRDLNAAVEFIQAHKQDMPMLLTVLVDTVNQKVKTNPDETEKWISTLDMDSRKAALVQFMSGVARYHPEKFHSYLEKIDPACFRDYRLCSLIAQKGKELDGELTQTWINTLPDRQKKYVLRGGRNSWKSTSVIGSDLFLESKKKEEDLFFFDYDRRRFEIRRNFSWK